MDKRLWLVAVFLVLFLVSPVFGFSGSGSGTEGSPYQITNYSQLVEIHSKWKGSSSTYYRLENDIDCAGALWTPLSTIDSYVEIFQLNGNGYTISNFRVEGAYAEGSSTGAGFIGLVNGLSYPRTGGVFRNLVFKNATVINTDGNSGNFAGVLAAHIDGDHFDTPYFADQVFIYDSSVSCGASNCYAGVAIGRHYMAGRLNNVGIYNSTVSSDHSGALTGSVYHPSDGIYGLYIWTNVSAKSIVGYKGGSETITNGYWDNGFGTAGQLGASTSTANMKVQGTYSGWDFTNTWKMSGATTHFAGYPVFKWFNDYSDVTTPVASFTKDSTGGTSPVTVHFTDTSANTPTSWFWVFGDGSTTNNTVQSPYHTFSGAGTYNVNLTATNSAGSNTTATQSIVVGVAPTASFTKDVSSGGSPLTVTFTFTGSGADSYYWVFGDGDTTNDTQMSPIHTFSGAGTYNVNVTATNTYGSTTTATQAITVGNFPTASFTKDKSSGAAPLTVTFDGTYTGTPPLTYLWVFGDGSTTNNSVADPIHTFAGVGTYDVNVTVTNAYGYQTTATQGISVGVVPTANFTRVPTVAQPDDTTYTFTDTSSGATSWNWTFGDGAYSNLHNPTHQYHITAATTQKWTVILNATNAYGSNTKTWVDCVGEYKIVTGGFSATNKSGAAPLNVTFVDTSVNNSLRQFDYQNNGTWSLVGVTSYHTYTVPGTYSVKMHAYNTWNNSDVLKVDEVHVYNTLVPAFSASNVTPIEEQTITFTDATVGSPTAWNWSFGDGQYSTLQNPTHSYSGYSIIYYKLFNVSLTVNKTGVPNETLSKTNYINVSQIKPTILPYTVNKTSGTGYAPPGLPVQFGNQWDYGHADAFDWYFEGIHNISINPIVTFNVPGVFHVNYSATNEMGRSAWYNSTYSVLGHAPTVSGITVNPPVGTHYAPVATTMNVIETTQYAIQPVTYVWHYDDGTPDVTVISSNTYWTSPQEVWGNHTFTTVGTFNVTINASNAWGYDNSQFIVYTVSPPAVFGAPLKWVNNAGATITTARKGDALTFVFDTNVTGITGAYRYDRFYINVFRKDMTGAWVEALLKDSLGNEITTYNVQEYGIETMFTSDIHNWMPTGQRWNGYVTFTAADGNATYRGQVTAINTTSSITYPSSVLSADITVTDNPLLMSNVGHAANDTGGFALKLIIGVIVVLGLMAIPFLITREFNTYIEVFMIVLGLGLDYYLGLVDLWIIAGLGILAAVIVFFMSTGGRGGGDTTEGGGGDVG